MTTPKPSIKQQAGDERPASTERHYRVSRSDLPLSCPMPEMGLWNAHPRVYLPIEDSGQALCPYCGALYTLED